MARRLAPAAERNRQPILEVLQREFRDCLSVLEIGSGTGQHAVWLAAKMRWLIWQTSDLMDNLPGINAWIDEAGGSNVKRPFALDVRTPGIIEQTYDAVFSANTAHIMAIDAVNDMFRLVESLTGQNGMFCLYGPFKRNGAFSSDSNRRFDQSLRSQNAGMGIRDLEQLDEFATAQNMQRVRFYAMPANNNIVIWSNIRATVSGDNHAAEKT